MVVTIRELIEDVPLRHSSPYSPLYARLFSWVCCTLRKPYTDEQNSGNPRFLSELFNSSEEIL